MNKSIIVYGPQGCGKTRYAERIAEHFGLVRIVDGYTGLRQPYERDAFDKFGGVLYLTFMTRAEIAAALMLDPSEFRRLVSFAEVAKQINDAIPLTDWRGHQEYPAAIGFYDVAVKRGSRVKQPKTNCWWDGNFFRDDEHYHSRFALEVGDKWRGLSEEPIAIK